MHKIFTFLLLIFVFLQCKTIPPATGTIENNTTTDSQEEFTPTVLTVILRANRSDSLLVLENVIKAKGWLKDQNTAPKTNLQEGDFVFSFMDGEGQVLQKMTMPSPLRQRYEVSDENGVLNSHTVEKETGVMSLRVTDTGNLVRLKVEQRDGENLKFIQVFDL